MHISWVWWRLDHVLTTNKQIHSFSESLQRPSLQGDLGILRPFWCTPGCNSRIHICPNKGTGGTQTLEQFNWTKWGKRESPLRLAEQWGGKSPWQRQQGGEDKLDTGRYVKWQTPRESPAGGVIKLRPTLLQSEAKKSISDNQPLFDRRVKWSSLWEDIKLFYNAFMH